MKQYKLAVLLLAVVVSGLTAQQPPEAPTVKLDPVTQTRWDTWNDVTQSDSVRLDAVLKMIQSSSSGDTALPPNSFQITRDGLIAMADTTTYRRARAYGIHMKALKAVCLIKGALLPSCTR